MLPYFLPATVARAKPDILLHPGQVRNQPDFRADRKACDAMYCASVFRESEKGKKETALRSNTPVSVFRHLRPSIRGPGSGLHPWAGAPRRLEPGLYGRQQWASLRHVSLSILLYALGNSLGISARTCRDMQLHVRPARWTGARLQSAEGPMIPKCRCPRLYLNTGICC
jgi:hypothetical protein